VTVLLDTGPLVAMMDRSDRHHRRCVRLLEELPPPLLLPSTVIVEACWVVNSHVGPIAQAALLDALSLDISRGRYTLVELAGVDLLRMAELARGYRDLRLDPTDASVIAMAERLGIKQVATLDRRDFGVVRPRHVDAFQLLP
jgi:predicted nucleic acid-binding protein